MATAALPVFFLLICSVTAQRGSSAPPTDPYARFTPSIAIIIAILLAAFFFMAFFALYVRRCADNDPASVQAGGATRGILRSRRAAAPRGLDPEVVATFPTLDYLVVKELKLGKSTLECAVCLCEFDDGEALRLLPPCSHVFHPDCIDEWLRSHTTCPVCRADLTPAQTANSPELPAAEADSVAIDIDANYPTQEPETAEAAAAAEQLPPTLPPLPKRAKSMRRARFSRSHSTGHSVVQPGENCDRYTLRLPDEIRKEVLKGKLNRTGSSIAGDREGSARGRSFGRWERFARSDRWGLSLAPPFFSRSFSGRVSSRTIRRGKEETAGGEGSVGRSGRVLLTTVKAPFDCLTGARSGADPGESSAVPVFTVPVSGERV